MTTHLKVSSQTLFSDPGTDTITPLAISPINRNTVMLSILRDDGEFIHNPIDTKIIDKITNSGELGYIGKEMKYFSDQLKNKDFADHIENMYKEKHEDDLEYDTSITLEQTIAKDIQFHLVNHGPDE